ncbi:MAG: peptidoglycan binding domain-containing protein, partial [Firmicutes bacterium]|nr:peptidoglycan binding domain-containing protein [Bacillota bacterium]
MDSDATQRVYLHEDAPQSEPAGQSGVQPAPVRRRPPQSGTAAHSSGRTGTHSRAPRRKRYPLGLKKNEFILLCCLIVLIVILLIAILALAIRSFSSDEDDGLILDNVIAAGVNLGGMDADQAAAALESATGSTYTQLSMTVTVLDTTVTLSPTDTGASLDIAAVVEEAYNYGRTGSSSDQQNARKQAATQSHVVDILPYLNLDTDYIQSVVDDLGERYSSTLTPSSITLSGTVPSVNVTNPDTSVTYQTLTIFTGTAEYGLDTSELYEQIMD